MIVVYPQKSPSVDAGAFLWVYVKVYSTSVRYFTANAFIW